MDWTFWAVATSLVAIVLSQLPPVRLLLKPKRLDVEVHSRIQITHKVGNPNVSLHVSIGNSGGIELRVRSLALDLTRDGKPLLSLVAQNYFHGPTDQVPILFIPFSIKPGEHWSHGVNFLNLFDRTTDKNYRENASKLLMDIQRKLAARPPADKEAVKASPHLVAPFVELFDRLFLWEPGEYVVALAVKVEPGSASYVKKYRFTLYESDTAELRKHIEDYQYGAGISYNVDKHLGVFVPLSEHIG
ncbi:MAG TPA: hypothetical protein VGL59_12300 [Polyangia bacterium]